VLYRAIYIGDSGIIAILLATGANPETVNVSGETALQYALKKGIEEIVSLLLNYIPQREQVKE